MQDLDGELIRRDRDYNSFNIPILHFDGCSYVYCLKMNA